MSVASSSRTTVVSADAVCVESSFVARLADLLEMCRPRIAVMTMVAVTAGFVLASPIVIQWMVLAAALAGILQLVAASSILNQVLEASTDAVMDRTSGRPLVSGRVSRLEATLVGLLFAFSGTAVLFVFSNPATMAAGVATLLVYVLVYTPLKSCSSLCTTVGAIPGAMPPVLGWLAAGGPPDTGALAMFALLFTWQFPHFLAIGWIYRADYQRAALRMLPSFSDSGRTAGIVAVVYALAFVPVSMMPAWVGLTGDWYLLTAGTLSLMYLVVTVRFATLRSDRRGRTLLLTSLFVLPALLMVMVAEFLWLTTPG